MDKRHKVMRALSVYLVNAGLESTMCGPAALGLMAIFQKFIDTNDMDSIINAVNEDAIEYNRWIAEHHPSFSPQIVFSEENK